MTHLLEGYLRSPHVAHVHFPNYTKAEFITITSSLPPDPLPKTTAAETAELWTRFCGAVHDALAKPAARTLPALQGACKHLWPRFTRPIREGSLGPKDFTKLLIAARVHFQDESLLAPGLVKRPPQGQQHDGATQTPRAPDKHVQALPLLGTASPTAETTAETATATATALPALLPTTARVLLIAAYLASHNAARHDLALFSTYHHGRRRRRRGGPSAAGAHTGKHRKIARRLLGAHAFVLERMMAIFATVRHEWALAPTNKDADADIDADVGMSLATLSSLRLLTRVGASGDPLDRAGKWRVNVGWEVIRSLGRSLHVEVEEWLVE